MIIKHGTGIIAGLLIVLSAQANYTVLAPPSPALCRSVGVAVSDEDAATGRIVEYHIADQRTVNARCQRPFGSTKGCAIPVFPGEYIVYTVGDTDSIESLHEVCHSVYEIGEHTTG